MCHLIRLATSISADIFSLCRPFSNFRFLESRHEFGGQGKVALSRIFSQARRASAKTLVLESLPSIAELKDEVEELSVLKPAVTDGGAWRLSFFRSSFDIIEDISKIPDNDLVGYAIIRRDAWQTGGRCHVFESVFSKYNHRVL